MMKRVLIPLCIILASVLPMTACATGEVKKPCVSGIENALPRVVHSKVEFDQRMRAGATPLDAFTPFGKREFIAGLVWNSDGKGIGGLSMAAMIRELGKDQVEEVLDFLDLKKLSASIVQSLPQSPPLRFGEPDRAIEREWKATSTLIDTHVRLEETAGTTTNLGFDEVVAHYNGTLGAVLHQADLGSRSLTDLMLIFDAASNVASATGDSATYRDMQTVFAELERRKVDTRRVFDARMLSGLVVQRRFDEAREFLAEHPDSHAEKIPDLTDSLGSGFNGRSVMDLDPQTHSLDRQAIANTAGTQVIMMVGATCHFSLEALEAIAANGDLRNRLHQAKLLILTPPGANLQLAAVGMWNARHPELPMRIPWSRAEWKAVDVAQVPQFLIFENGKLKQRILGWEGNQAALSEALGRLDP
ncbi:MAG TPA: hypothetical protein VFN25_09735 [Dokdonella sp.]|uniref:hypothetical protein n=1 Tax=Dokdonella sp. TaxID=2291710 RepID=UPI002D7FBBCF|nr:hypothetical protein [Dokdonella sp.]HET9033174.1 hypothetical protein [Dokdonella sp.]